MKKKIFALLLSFVMVFGLSVTAFAADAYSGDPNGSYDSSVVVEFAIDSSVTSYDTTYLPTGSAPWSGTYHFNANEGKTALNAIKAVAEVLRPDVSVVTGGSGTDAYISSLFGLATINNYGSNSWEGYYWSITLTGDDPDDSEVEFESPYYPGGINLGQYQVFENPYDETFPITAKITKITMTYKHDIMTW